LLTPVQKFEIAAHLQKAGGKGGYRDRFKLIPLPRLTLAMFFTLVHWFLSTRGGNMDHSAARPIFIKIRDTLDMVKETEWVKINAFWNEIDMSAPVIEAPTLPEMDVPAGDDEDD
jgi:hypothetical protein